MRVLQVSGVPPFLGLMVVIAYRAFFSLLIIVAKDVEMMQFFTFGKFWLAAFAMPLSCLNLLLFFYPQHKQASSAGMFIFLFTIPALTALTAIIPQLHPLLFYDFQAITVAGIATVSFSAGWMFKVYMAFSQLLFAYTVGILSKLFRTGNQVHRKQALIILTGGLSVALVDILSTLLTLEMRWLQINSACYLLVVLTLGYAIFKLGFLDLAWVAKERLFMKIPAALMVVDRNGLIQVHNNQAQALCRSDFVLQGKKITDVLRHCPQLAEAVLNQQTGKFKVPVTEEITQWWELRIEPLTKGHQGHEPVASLAVFYDITNLHETEQRERDKAVKLEQIVVFRNRLLSILSHDVVGNIRAHERVISMLLDEYTQLSEIQKKELLDSLQESMVETTYMLIQLISWSKSQQDGFVPSVQELDLRVLVRESINRCKLVASLYRVELILETGEGYAVILGDAEMLGSIARNLLVNAIKASPPGEAVRILMSIDDEAFVVSIQNKIHPGQGEILPERIHLAGFGLGLQICRDLASACSLVLQTREISQNERITILKGPRAFSERPQPSKEQ
jgi:hypothetical protein